MNPDRAVLLIQTLQEYGIWGMWDVDTGDVFLPEKADTILLDENGQYVWGGDKEYTASSAISVGIMVRQGKHA